MNFARVSAEFQGMGRILPLVALGLALAGPPALWGQFCTPAFPGTDGTVADVAVSPGSVVDGGGELLTATITLTGMVGWQGGSMFVGVPLGIRYGSGDIQFVGGPDGIIGFGEKGVRGRRVSGEKGVRNPFFVGLFSSGKMR